MRPGPNAACRAAILLTFLVSANSAQVPAPRTAAPQPATPAPAKAATPQPAASPPAAPKPAAPQPEPTAGAEQGGEVVLNSDLVVVSAVVTKLHNQTKFVRDLTAADFTVLDEGRPQQIAFFGNESLPLDVVFLFDSSESMHFRQQFQREALGTFMRTLLRPNDHASVVWFNSKIHVEQDFTSNTPSLLGAIDRIPSGGATVLYDAVVDASARLKDKTGRRAIVILSDGRDTFSNTRLAQALAAAQLADVAIYAINTSFAKWAVTDDFRRNDPLEYLASETGGEVYYSANQNDVDDVLSRLSGSLRERYVLGFYPADPASTGRYRRLTVTVGRKDARVLARRGYYAR